MVPRKRYRTRAAFPSAEHATRSVTIDDVAKFAGVSRMTVSRALNKPELVNKDTLALVRAVVERTGYVPNMMAGGLASRRSRMVAAIVPSITNSIFVETIQVLTDTLWEAGYQVALGLAGYPPKREEALLAALLSRRPDAIYLTGITHSPATRQRLLSARVPVVETWDLTPAPVDMLVGFSHEQVGRAVAQYLLSRGYRRLGVVSADDERARVRLKGFLGAVSLPEVATETVFLPAPSSLEAGRRGISALFQRNFAPDAVFCSSDLLAQGVLEEARLRKLRVPQQLAIMGFGGLDFTEHTVPALSSVAVDRKAIGQQAAQLILDRIANRAAPGSVIDVGFKIVERETS